MIKTTIVVLASPSLVGGLAAAQGLNPVTIEVKDSTVTISGSVMVPDSAGTLGTLAEVDKNEITVKVVRGRMGAGGTMSPERRFFEESVEKLPPGIYGVKVYYDGNLMKEETVEIK